MNIDSAQGFANIILPVAEHSTLIDSDQYGKFSFVLYYFVDYESHSQAALLLSFISIQWHSIQQSWGESRIGSPVQEEGDLQLIYQYDISYPQAYKYGSHCNSR